MQISLSFDSCVYGYETSSFIIKKECTFKVLENKG
jgi:hypothetical protein